MPPLEVTAGSQGWERTTLWSTDTHPQGGGGHRHQHQRSLLGRTTSLTGAITRQPVLSQHARSCLTLRSCARRQGVLDAMRERRRRCQLRAGNTSWFGTADSSPHTECLAVRYQWWGPRMLGDPSSGCGGPVMDTGQPPQPRGLPRLAGGAQALVSQRQIWQREVHILREQTERNPEGGDLHWK